LDVSSLRPIVKGAHKIKAIQEEQDEEEDDDDDEVDEVDEVDASADADTAADQEKLGESSDDDDDDDDADEISSLDAAAFQLDASEHDDDESIVSFDAKNLPIPPTKSKTLVRKISKRLPIKDAQGRIIVQEEDDDDDDRAGSGSGSGSGADDDDDDDDDADGSGRAHEGGSDESASEAADDAADGDGGDDDDDEVAEKLRLKREAAQLRAARKRMPSALLDDVADGELRVEVARERIARACDAVMQAPEENLAMISDIEHLMHDVSDAVSRLAILSLLAVFRHILPPVPIRSDYSGEADVRVSREIAEQRRFELSLLNAFTTYVRDLTYMLTARRTVVQTKLACARALGGLLAARPDFNLQNELIATLVAAVCVRHDETAFEACRQMAGIFAADPTGELSLRLVRSINRVLKAHPERVRPQLLEAMRSLHLRESMTEVDPATVKNGMRESRHAVRTDAHLSRGARRDRKTQRIVEHDVRDFHADRTKEARTRVYIDLLNAVFLIYFRVLKQLAHTPLLPLALDGCAKHAHLINIEMMNDLLRVLEKLLRSAATNPTMRELPVRLKCVLAGYRALRNQGYVIDIDVKQFSSELYEQLLYVPSVMLPNALDANDYTAELLYAVFMAVIEQPNIEVARAAAFAKRLASLALNMSPSQACTAIVLIQHIMRKYPRVSALLDVESAVSGLHLPWIEDPAHCNALAATLWELTLLASHWNPTVRKYALATVQAKFARLDPDVTLKSLRELVHGLDTTSRGTFDPPVREPPAASQKRSRSAHAHTNKKDEFIMRGVDERRLRARRAYPPHAELGATEPAILHSLDAAGSAVDRFRRRRATARAKEQLLAMEVQLTAYERYKQTTATTASKKKRLVSER
jgi:nucleolar complex protein 3